MQPSSRASATRPLLLTGAGGWFGVTALHVFEQTYGPVALRERVVPFASRARQIDFGSAYGPIQAFDLRELLDVPDPGGLLHLAFLTRDRVEDVGLDAYVATNRGITSKVAKLLQSHPTLPIITTSSGAAAALDEVGLDLEGNPYATLKQEEEKLLLCESIMRMAVVFRVYAASGRFMRGAERFALGDFLLQALSGQRLKINSLCPVERSYVHVGTLMELAWSLLLTPDAPGYQAIDACTDHISLLELARLISCREGLPEPEHKIDFLMPSDSYGADSKIFFSKLKERKVCPLNLAGQIMDTKAGLVKCWREGRT
jgi:nucleoside-diphosphate-sugar epimerase